MPTLLILMTSQRRNNLWETSKLHKHLDSLPVIFHKLSLLTTTTIHLNLTLSKSLNKYHHVWRFPWRCLWQDRAQHQAWLAKGYVPIFVAEVIRLTSSRIRRVCQGHRCISLRERSFYDYTGFAKVYPPTRHWCPLIRRWLHKGRRFLMDWRSSRYRIQPRWNSSRHPFLCYWYCKGLVHPGYRQHWIYRSRCPERSYQRLPSCHWIWIHHQPRCQLGCWYCFVQGWQCRQWRQGFLQRCHFLSVTPGI